MNEVRGEQDGTGNHDSCVIAPLVCSSILLMQSGIVMRYFSLSFFVILSSQRHRLEVDRPYGLHIVVPEVDYAPQFVVVDALDDRGHQDDPDSRLVAGVERVGGLPVVLRVGLRRCRRRSSCTGWTSRASFSLPARDGSSARLIPLVLSWTWSTPSSFSIRIICGSSSRIVGSPPVIWTEFPGTGLSAFSVRAISLIWSRVGS